MLIQNLKNMSLKNHNNKIGLIFSVVRDCLEISKKEIVSKSRKKPIVIARRIILNILSETLEEPSLSQKELGEIVNRDRTTFIHHRKEHIKEYSMYKDYQETYNSVKEKFEESIK